MAWIYSHYKYFTVSVWGLKVFQIPTDAQELNLAAEGQFDQAFCYVPGPWLHYLGKTVHISQKAQWNLQNSRETGIP